MQPYYWVLKGPMIQARGTPAPQDTVDLDSSGQGVCRNLDSAGTWYTPQPLTEERAPTVPVLSFGFILTFIVNIYRSWQCAYI